MKMEVAEYFDSVFCDKTANDFKFLKTLSDGSFSTVYLAQDISSDNRYAIKVFSKKDMVVKEMEKELLAECKVLGIMKAHGGHPFILSLYHSFADNLCYYIVMTYADDYDLHYHIKKLGSFEDEVARFYAAEIICALEFMHNFSIIHRDLKPENILMNRTRHIMLADFGSSKVFMEKNEELCKAESTVRDRSESTVSRISVRKHSFVGTAEYFSPEALNDEDIGPPCDYWALGAIIFQMVSGKPPFHGMNRYHVFQKIQKLDFSFPNGFPEICKDLVRKFLVSNPDERLGSEKIGGCAAVKEHGFFNSIDWANLPTTLPPQMKAYIPASGGEPAYHSDFINPEDIEPGFDAMAKSRLVEASLKEFLSNAASEARLIECKRQLSEQRQNNPYHHLVGEHLIIKSGILIKKKGLSYRRRMFLLTEGPHIHYVDETTKEYKGEIPMCRKLRTEGKNFRAFFVHTPNRTYYLFDPEEKAMNWCEAIDDLRNRYMQILPEVNCLPKRKRYIFL